jgi:hypothetical protein
MDFTTRPKCMQTLLLFLFYGSLMFLLYCAETIRWITSMTQPALLRTKSDLPLIMGMPEPVSLHIPRSS